MKENEGVIKYKLEHQYIPVNENISIAEINAWRSIFLKLGFIGQTKDRYDGYGFGNISQRVTTTDHDKLNFIISGTQTGHIRTLSNEQYCLIREACPKKNRIKSAGEIKPSSEALTHANVYQLNNKILSVIHIHCPEIWQNSQRLNLPCTSKDIPYGTPEMANEVNRLFQNASFPVTAVFSMLGHEDGIISFSDSMEKAAYSLIGLYSKAIVIDSENYQSYNIRKL